MLLNHFLDLISDQSKKHTNVQLTKENRTRISGDAGKHTHDRAIFGPATTFRSVLHNNCKDFKLLLPWKQSPPLALDVFSLIIYAIIWLSLTLKIVFLNCLIMFSMADVYNLFII